MKSIDHYQRLDDNFQVKFDAKEIKRVVDLINLNKSVDYFEDDEEYISFSCSGCDCKLPSDWVNGFKKK